ncbi:MAG TPA: SUMF1/EgtB/PvdO family nonheme iron enzyme, partial [Candidatus Methylacidiphilales bacterium]
QVGSFKPNAHGLYDMGGNVWQWCEDIFNRSADFRVLHGASWRMRDPEDLLSSARIGNRPDIRLAVYGCRLVIELPEAPAPDAAAGSAGATNAAPVK